MLTCKKLSRSTNDESTGFQRLILLFMAGFLIVVVGVVVLVVATILSDGSTNLGAVIFIGPFPIVVGVGIEPWMILFSIILAVLSVIMFFVLRREVKRANV